MHDASRASKERDALSAVVARVRAKVSANFTPSFCLQLSVACALKRPDDVLGLMLSFAHAKRFETDASLARDVGITESEWDTLFRSAVSPISNPSICRFVDQPEFKEEERRLTNAFALTMLEADQKSVFAKPYHKIAIHVATNLGFHESAIASSLGTVLKADHRKLDDMISDLEDGELDAPVMTCQALNLMCSALVSAL